MSFSVRRWFSFSKLAHRFSKNPCTSCNRTRSCLRLPCSLLSAITWWLSLSFSVFRSAVFSVSAAFLWVSSVFSLVSFSLACHN
ncbi:hypothetical protein E5L64_00290 [Helicobacter pylori]|nr:hypothetical protein E5L64_00290 [Helicobacter pylori]